MLSAERSRTYRAGSLPANTSAGLPQTPDIRCRSDHTVWKEFHEGNTHYRPQSRHHGYHQRYLSDYPRSIRTYMSDSESVHTQALVLLQ